MGTPGCVEAAGAEAGAIGGVSQFVVISPVA